MRAQIVSHEARLTISRALARNIVGLATRRGPVTIATTNVNAATYLNRRGNDSKPKNAARTATAGITFVSMPRPAAAPAAAGRRRGASQVGRSKKNTAVESIQLMSA